ncbi:ATP/GTP-binding protein [Sorangium sp. So ce1151]|uniref:ATP/GTP-binding protein n=1 Tax=Sorangium sp. So ce1151 TaxID=3133332 RepID=UPI003F6103CE
MSVDCRCTGPAGHRAKLVVLTGGPGGGKTLALGTLRSRLCAHVAVVPEIAGIVFGSGFPRFGGPAVRRAAQRAIFHLQREYERALIAESGAAVIVCDRGTIDGLAYWPDSAESYFREMNTSREEELSRYATVIHLHTIARSAHGRFTDRHELPAAAVELDERQLRNWEGHPRRFIVDVSDDFSEKITRVIELVRGELPACCGDSVRSP